MNITLSIRHLFWHVRISHKQCYPSQLAWDKVKLVDEKDQTFTSKHWPLPNSRCTSTLKCELAFWLWLETSVNMRYTEGCSRRTIRSLAQKAHFLLSCEQGTWTRGRFGTAPRVSIKLIHHRHEVLGVCEVSLVFGYKNYCHFRPKFWSGSWWWRHDWSFERFHTSTSKTSSISLPNWRFFPRITIKRQQYCIVISIRKSDSGQHQHGR